jgi:hypothetical protein
MLMGFRIYYQKNQYKSHCHEKGAEIFKEIITENFQMR